MMNQSQGKNCFRRTAVPHRGSFGIVPANTRTGVRKVKHKGQNIGFAVFHNVGIVQFDGCRV